MKKNRFFLGETKEYNVFDFLESNRDINDSKVKKLMKSIQQNGLQVPIVVNDGKQIVDGQHRFVALRTLGYAVPYIVSQAWTDENDTITMQESTKWNALDYCKSLATRGNIDCESALKIAEDFFVESDGKMDTIRSLELLMDGNKWNVLTHLKRETYKINTEVANHIFDAIQLMSEHPTGTSVYGARIVRPLKALYYINEGLDLEIIEKMVKDNYIKGFAKETDQLEYFIDLYNKY